MLLRGIGVVLGDLNGETVGIECKVGLNIGEFYKTLFVQRLQGITVVFVSTEV